MKHVNVHCKSQQRKRCAFYCQDWILDDLTEYHLFTKLQSDKLQLFRESNGLIVSHLVRGRCVILSCIFTTE